MKYRFFKIAFSIVLLTVGINSCQEEREHSLPVIHIKYYADHLGLGDYSDSELKLLDEKGNVVYQVSHDLKYRGNSSFQYSKKSFTLKFDQPKAFASMEKSHYWKLNADYIDKTFMRNTLSYDLFRSFSEGNFAPKIDFAVLYENGKYQGIYSVCEGVNEFRLGLNLIDPKAVLFKEPPLHNHPSKHYQRYKDLAHYYEVDDRFAYYSQKAKRKLIKTSYYNQRYPDIYTTNKNSDIHELTEFIFNSSNEEFIERVFTDYFDFNNILDWHLLLLVTNNGDGIKKNNYIYKKGAKQPYLYCPWDFDHSFGREGDGEPIKEDICDIESHKLFERLLELNPDRYIQRLQSKFMTLKNTDVISVKHLHEMIDQYAVRLGPEIKQNEKRWPLDAVAYFKGSDFEKEVQLMKDWIESRIPRIETYLKELQSENKAEIPIVPARAPKT